MLKGIKREVILTVGVLLIFATVKFFEVHIKQVEEVRPFEVVETGVVHNSVKGDGEQVKEESFQGTGDDIIRLTNKFRTEQGFTALVKNSKLMESAQAKARDMREQKYFAHTSPDGIELWNLVQQTGYRYTMIAENIAEGYFSAESVVEAWINSEGHRANILSDKLEEIGVAVLEIENKQKKKSYVLVQHFATPQQEATKARKVEVVCDKQAKKNCKKIEEKKEEYRELVKKQEREIEKAENKGFSRKELIELFDNLDKLKSIRDQYKEFSAGCEVYINKCDRWE